MISYYDKMLESTKVKDGIEERILGPAELRTVSAYSYKSDESTPPTYSPLIQSTLKGTVPSTSIQNTLVSPIEPIQLPRYTTPPLLLIQYNTHYYCIINNTNSTTTGQYTTTSNTTHFTTNYIDAYTYYPCSTITDSTTTRQYTTTSNTTHFNINYIDAYTQ